VPPAAHRAGADRVDDGHGQRAREHRRGLELGGSDPFIVLADADVDQAARRGAAARVVNSGQSCIAAKRFIVVDAVANAFTRAFVAAMEALVVDDPQRDDTQVGPLARHRGGRIGSAASAVDHRRQPQVVDLRHDDPVAVDDPHRPDGRVRRAPDDPARGIRLRAPRLPKRWGR
jgi:hypothetical protein